MCNIILSGRSKCIKTKIKYNNNKNKVLCVHTILLPSIISVIINHQQIAESLQNRLPSVATTATPEENEDSDEEPDPEEVRR